jgi:glycine cleavage system H protein
VAFGEDLLVANRDPYGSGWIARLQPDQWPPADVDLVSGDDALRRYTARIDELGVSCFRCAD